MASAPNRIQLKHKNEAAWQQFHKHLNDRPYLGAAYTLSEVQAKRPGLHDFADQLTSLTLPVLLLCGDEDEPCLDINLWLKRTLPLAGLKIYPKSGHLLNLEMPEQFSQDILTFLKLLQMDAGASGLKRPLPRCLTLASKAFVRHLYSR